MSKIGHGSVALTLVKGSSEGFWVCSLGEGHISGFTALCQAPCNLPLFLLVFALLRVAISQIFGSRYHLKEKE
jgi:hypothetical protein